MKEKFKQYIYLMRLHKPIGMFLLLWPTLWALWVAARGMPPLEILFVFVMGVILTRSAGCVINDYADKHIDVHVKRTMARPLAADKVRRKEAIILVGVLLLLAFALVLLLNWFTISLALVAVVIAIIYPFAKRFTYLPQFVLGLAFAWGIPMAFAAVTNSLSLLAGILFIATYSWIIAYDTMYAMVDRDDDLKIGVKSTAILFGEFDKLMIFMFQLFFLGLLLGFGILAGLGPSYYIAWFVVVGLSLYQQYLIKDRIREQCFKAFLNNHWLGMIIFIGIVLSYYFR